MMLQSIHLKHSTSIIWNLHQFSSVRKRHPRCYNKSTKKLCNHFCPFFVLSGSAINSLALYWWLFDTMFLHGH